MGNTVQLLKDGQPVFPVTDVSLVMGLQDAIKLPPVKVATLPTASASTAGKMYYVGPDGNDEYERYITSAVGGSYSWIDLGDTSIPLPSIADNLTTADANTALSANQGVVLAGQIGQLDQKVFVFHTGTLAAGGWRQTGFSVKNGTTYNVYVDVGRFVAYKIGTGSQVNLTATTGQTAAITADADGALSVYCGDPTQLTIYVGNNPLELRIEGDEARLKVLDDNLALKRLILVGNNLFDKNTCITGYLQSGGSIATDGVGPNYWTSDFIPIEAATTYYVTARSQSIVVRSRQFYNANKIATTYSNTEADTFTSGANDVYVRVSIAKSFNLEDVCISTYNTYQSSYIYADTDAVFNEKNAKALVMKKDLAAFLTKGNNVTITKSGYDLGIQAGDIEIQARLDEYRGASQYYYNGNHEFNFMSYKYVPSGEVRQVSDDVAPSHLLNTTLGANHGQPCVRATITGHGLTNTSIGTAWVQDGNTFYIVRIVDENNILLLSANTGTAISPVFRLAQTGTIVNGGTTLTITAITNTQFLPNTQNISQTILLNGNEEITEDGSYECNFVDVVETYEVADPWDVLANLIANAGSADDPDMTGDPIVTYRNVYRFLSGGSVVIITTITPNREIEMRDLMFAQSKVPTATTPNFSFYVPGSLPVGSDDFRTPYAPDWTGKEILFRTANWADENHPVNRVVTYGQDYGFALGFLPVGVGAELDDYTTVTLEMSNGGKIYAHGVDTQVGTTIQAGQAFVGVMYRAIVNKSTVANRLSLYSIALNDETYVYADYSGSLHDVLLVDGVNNGAKVEVVESRNATLVTDVYNNGVFVNASYVANDTCYIVLRIK